MPAARDKLVLYGTAAVLRLLLFVIFPSLPSLLTSRVEISTPVSSFKRLQEGLYLYTHNVSPYDGGVYHQAPLLLPLFSLLPNYRTSPLWSSLVFIFADLLSAEAVYRIAATGVSVSTPHFTSSRKDIKLSPTVVAGAYLFSPFAILSCLAQSTTLLTNSTILLAIASASTGDVVNSVFALALSAYLSLYPILLVVPLALFACDCSLPAASKGDVSASLRFCTTYAISVLGVLGGLLGLSYLIMGSSWEFISSTYGFQLLLTDLTPNVGLWWYFFIEMFDSFREFFLGVFWLHMASYVVGVSLRIRKQPLFAITCLLGIFAIFKPYPAIADASLYFAMLPLYRHIFPLLRYGFIASAALLYASFLGPAFHYLWLYAGSGNANFFYAITLVWSMGLTIIVGDTTYAVLRDEAEVERPELKGQALRQI